MSYNVLKKISQCVYHWDIVGGCINAGARLIDNLRREVMEETKLSITSEPRLVFAQDIIIDNEKHVVHLTYVGATEGNPVLDMDENVDYKWLSLQGLEKQDRLDEYVKEVLSNGCLNT